MIHKLPERIFFIFVALLLIVFAVVKLPYFKSKFSHNYRMELFSELSSSLENNNFDPEEYWEFRERFSPGTFLRDEQNTDFFATFRITHVTDSLTPLFYYDSRYIRSLDAVVTGSAKDTLDIVKKDFPGEIVFEQSEYILIKASENEYVFAFVKPIETMKQVVGMFDYIPKEMELLQAKQWYNVTYINTK